MDMHIAACKNCLADMRKLSANSENLYVRRKARKLIFWVRNFYKVLRKDPTFVNNFNFSTCPVPYWCLWFNPDVNFRNEFMMRKIFFLENEKLKRSQKLQKKLRKANA